MAPRPAAVLLAAVFTLAAAASAFAQERPKIGVAFGGGSAKGIAHVGVIRWFEEHRIPIDVASGTSMGGLIGGCYATGMSSAELDRMLSTMNWDELFGASSFAFKNIRRKTDARAYPSRLEFGLRKGFSPPTSLNTGEQVDLLIARITAPYFGIASFDELPTPFRAVAVDLLSATQVVLDRGSIASAMRKFQCWQLDPDRAFYGRKGEKIAVGEVKIVLTKNKGGENRASLHERTDTNNEHEIKADRVKVKYLRPPHPDHERRYNEVFTEVAATRIMWALGFPADHTYPVASATCVGCSADPFKDNLKDNKASLRDAGTVFRAASVARDIPLDAIDPEDDETWSWRDVAGFYANGQFSRQQKVEYDAYRLALGLMPGNPNTKWMK